MIYATVAHHTKPNGIEVTQIVSWSRDVEWDDGLQIDWETYQYSDHHLSVYRVVKLTDDHLPFVQAAVQCVGDPDDPDSLRSGTLFGGDIGEWCSALDLTHDEFLSDDSLPVLDGTGISTDCWVDYEFCDFEEVEDTAVITAGDYTIGTSQNYADLASFDVDITTMTGPLTGTVKTAITETTANSFDASQSTYKFRITSDFTGNDPTAGYKITSNVNTIAVIRWRGDGTGDVEIDHLNILHGNIASVPVIYNVGNGAAFNFLIHDNVIDQNNNANYGINVNDADATAYVYNNMVCCGSSLAAIITLTANANTVIESNTIWTENGGAGITASNLAIDILNNIVIVDGVAFTTVGSATGNYNIGSDDTGEDGDFSSGTGNQINKTSAVFVSTVAGATYLAIDSDSDAFEVGGSFTISGHTTYINGVAEKATNDIGAFGFEAAGGVSNSLFFGTLF